MTLGTLIWTRCTVTQLTSGSSKGGRGRSALETVFVLVVHMLRIQILQTTHLIFTLLRNHRTDYEPITTLKLLTKKKTQKSFLPFAPLQGPPSAE